MAATSTIPKHPLIAKTLIFDFPSQTFNIYAFYPVPMPDPAKNDHLIQVKSTALCTRELFWPALFPAAMFAENPEKQITPGYDLAGTVITAPPASPFSPGDEIYARTRASRPENCREYTIARTEEMALKPQKLNWLEAATVPLSAITAWQALFKYAGVKGLDDSNTAGKRALIVAAAGGVGIWLVQLARIAGLEVVAQVGNAKNDKFVRGLGASETVNYKIESLKEWGEREGPVDIVIDLLGGKTLEDAWYCVKDGGSLISNFEPPEGKRPEGLKNKVVKIEFFIMEPNGQNLAEVSRLLNERHCRAVVDSVWDFEDYNRAFERLGGGHANGKVVIKITEYVFQTWKSEFNRHVSQLNRC